MRIYIRIPLWLSAGLLGLLTLSVYWAGLQGGFFFDDGPSILHSPGVKMTDFSWESIRQAWYSGGAGPTGRPVAQLTFALNHYFSGFSPFAFKTTNLAIHGLCAVLIYRVTRQLLLGFSRSGQQQYTGWLAGAIAALWLMHPIQLLPVLHVVQRMSSLSALFLLMAFLLHILARERGGWRGGVMLLLAWVMVWPLSMMSKEIGALFPLFVLAWELLLRKAAVGQLDRFAKAYIALTVAVAIGVSVYLLSEKSQWLWAGYELRPFTLSERLLTESRVIWFYIGLSLLPRLSALGLHHDDIAISTGWLSPWTTLPSVSGLVVLLILVWKIRQRIPLFAFGVAWYLVGQLMESTVLPLEIAHEHRNYLPLFGVLLAASGLLSSAMDRYGVKKNTGMALAIFLLAYCSLITAIRAHQYGDELRRTLAEARYHPASSRAQNEAGLTLANLPEAAVPTSMIHSAARGYYERATQLDPNFKAALSGMLALDCKTGANANRAYIDELSRRLRETFFAPGDRNILYYVKELEVAGQRCLARAEVENLFDAALNNRGVEPVVRAVLYSWLADYLWLRERDLPAAKHALRQSLDLNPSNISNRLKWAQVLWIDGDRQKATRLLLELRRARLTADERNTLNELLTEGNITQP